MVYKASDTRYHKMIYRRLGNSGLKLPVISLGLWYNFGGINDFDVNKEILLNAFDNGITHFDLANNYGPPPGSAEETFGKVISGDLKPYRDEIIVSTKAGYGMWPGPYGDGGSRKYLISSLNQSLKRLNLDYVDIFYHHRPDNETNLMETMIALADIIRSGKALYVGLSNYNSEQLKNAGKILHDLHVPFVITQPSYSMFNRWIERDGLLETMANLGGGTICFSVLSQGLLSNKYIDNIPEDSRAMKKYCAFLNKENISPEVVNKLIKLNEIAKSRKQTISQLAIVWALRNEKLTSVLMGVSKLSQLHENLQALDNFHLTEKEVAEIDSILRG